MTETEKARNIIKEWTTGEYTTDGRPLKRVLEIDDLDNLAIDLVKKLNIDDVSNCLHTWKPLSNVGEVMLICTKCNRPKGYC